MKLEVVYLNREKVESSNLESVGYDKKSQILEVEFHGGEIYQYFGVPEDVFEELFQAPSIGQYFNGNIRQRYFYEKGK